TPLSLHDALPISDAAHPAHGPRPEGGAGMSAAQPLAGQRMLVTGGAGTIGSHVVDQLVRAGAAEVVVLDNFVRGRMENLSWALRHGGDRTGPVDGAIRDRDPVRRLVAGTDGGCH